MKCAALLLAGCSSHAAPRLEHHVPPSTDETFILDAPLFTSDVSTTVVWTLERHGHAATLTLGDTSYRGTFEEHDVDVIIDVTGSSGRVTLACRRTSAKVHVAGAEPDARGDHPICTMPRSWHPADMRTVAALECDAQRDELVTKVTMAPPPGLQAVVDDCCDDDDRCDRRWEIRLR